MANPRLVIHMVADDLGSEQVGKFQRNGVSPGLAAQPFMDMLWDYGVRFENHYSEIFCSPYRANVMTGRHTEDHGIGDILEVDSDYPLLLKELLTPEVLRIYFGSNVDTAAIGKWHLGTSAVGGSRAALLAGFDYAFLSERNIDYFTTEMACQGDQYLPRGRYIPDVMGDAAITWLRRFAAQRGRKGYLYLPFHNPHNPWHRPSADLYDSGTWTCPDQVADPQSGATIVPYHKAMIEALDAWAKRIWDSMPAHLQNETLLLFSSDNGSDGGVLAQETYFDGTPYSGGHGKRSTWDPGIRTPAYAYSPNTGIITNPGRSVTGVVQSLDFFATTLEALGVPWQEIVEARAARGGRTAADRSKTLWSALQENIATTKRTYAYTASFSPNEYNRGTLPGIRAITDGRYKLRFPTSTPYTSTPDLYDIVDNPKETAAVVDSPGTVHPKRTELQEAWSAFYDDLPPLPG